MADAVMVRVSSETQERLLRISHDQHKSASEIIAVAVQAYEDTLFWDEYDRSTEALKADPAAWKAYKADMSTFDGTLRDGFA